jgi:hypothetical protein
MILYLVVLAALSTASVSPQEITLDLSTLPSVSRVSVDGRRPFNIHAASVTSAWYLSRNEQGAVRLTPPRLDDLLAVVKREGCADAVPAVKDLYEARDEEEVSSALADDGPVALAFGNKACSNGRRDWALQTLRRYTTHLVFGSGGDLPGTTHELILERLVVPQGERDPDINERMLALRKGQRPMLQASRTWKVIVEVGASYSP